MARWMVAATLALSGFMGCAESSAPTDLEADDPDQKADGVVSPIGTYVGTSTHAGDLLLLALKTDKTFHAEQLVTCVRAPCDPVALDGTYKFTKSTTTSRKYMRLSDAKGVLIERYSYKLSASGVLQLAVDPFTRYFKLTSTSDGWCDAPADCQLQNLPQPKCPGAWLCQDHTCQYSECSANDCVAAGGQCVALTPSSCKDGIVGDAGTYSCGGGLGVECCLPKPAAPTCQQTGTAQEGWYWADGSKVCLARCKGATASCGAVGTRSEGFYATSGAGCSGGNLVVWADCAN